MRRLAAAFAFIAMLGALPAQAQFVAPSNLMLTPTAGAEASSLDFSWSAASSPGNSISFQVVHLRVAGGSWGANEAQNDWPSGVTVTDVTLAGDTLDSGGVSMKFTNLQPATTYEARIRAEDDAGGSSAWAEARAETADGLPGAPALAEPT
ncbi:MAG: fibronectin type III domain-containing protein, partial [Gammaproteobacteria bacterium]